MRVVEREPRYCRSLVVGLAVALIGGVLAVAGAGVATGQETAAAQESADCRITNMGGLGAPAGSVLQAHGRWTTEDCDSRFRPGNDAHTYHFEVRSSGPDPHRAVLAGRRPVPAPAGGRRHPSRGR